MKAFTPAEIMIKQSEGSVGKANGGIWCAEAEKYLLENAPKLKY